MEILTSDSQMPNEGIETDIRIATTDDLPFVYNSWAMTMKHQYPNKYALDFVKTFHEYLKELIEQSTIIVAYLDDDPDEVISYLVYTSFRGRQVIHFAYTKLDARNQGHMRKLIMFSNQDALPIVFTHAPKNEGSMKAFCRKYIYDPSLIQLLVRHQ